MLLFEIKKIFLKPLSRFVLLALAAVLVFCTFMTVKDVRYVDAQEKLPPARSRKIAL